MEQTLTNEIGFVKIDCLPHKKLLSQLDVIIETDSNGFIARTPDIPLYGHGKDPIEAIDSLKYEIEALYDDLMEDNEFTDDWLRIKEYLKGKNQLKLTLEEFDNLLKCDLTKWDIKRL